MGQVFWISTTFLTGRYHGEEWPPSPARVVQAVVAGVKNGGNRVLWPKVAGGLRLLEAQQAPRIFVSASRELTPYRIAVPNNDLDVIARDWAAGRAASASSIRTMKTVTPRIIQGEGVPDVLYVWDIGSTELGLSLAELLTPGTHCLYSLGWGVDMAFADSGFSEVPMREGWEEWVPSKGSQQRFKVPVPGFVDDLENVYRRFTERASGAGVDADTRLSVYGLQPYAKLGEEPPRYAAFLLRPIEGDPSRPSGEETFSRPWRNAMEVSAWMRHAAGIGLKGEDIDEDFGSFVMGHKEGGDGASRRLSFVPLPTIHAMHGDARIRRVMVVEPPGGSGIATKLLELKWAGATLIAEGGRAVCSLEAGWDDGVIRAYTRKARVWDSVTPVILHGYNAARGTVSLGKTTSLLMRAFEMAGYQRNEIEDVAFQTAPLWPGAEAARGAKVPAHLNGYPRYHVRVRFREELKGPVLAGIGRHYGLGVFGARG